MRRIPTLVVASLMLLAGVLPATAGTWVDSVDEAVSEARESGKLILVDLYADWCRWCKLLEQNVFSSPQFQPYAERFVLLRVDVEDGANGTRLYERFGIESLPSTLLIDHRLARIGEVRGYAPPAAFLASLEREIAQGERLAQAYERIRGGRSPEQIRRLAEELHSRRDGRRSAELYSLLLAADSAAPKEIAWFEYLRADALRLDGDFDAATEQAGAAHASATQIEDRELLERIDFLRFRIARDAGRCDFAIAALQTFLVSYPGSALIGYLERELDTLRHEPVAECT